MYYKIINKDCEIYKKSYQLRCKELEIEKENDKIIKENIPYEWDVCWGYLGQFNVARVSTYRGFEFINPDIVDLNVWTKSKQHPTIFVPNEKTKKGREISKILDSLKRSSVIRVFDIFNIPIPEGNFKTPFLEICDDIILVYLPNIGLKCDENLLEITKEEFNNFIDKLNEKNKI